MTENKVGKELEARIKSGDIEAAHLFCAEMWNQIAEGRLDDKREAPIMKGVKLYIGCAYCEYYKKPTPCHESCPLWTCMDGEYGQWSDSTDPEERRNLAIAIADIACSAE